MNIKRAHVVIPERLVREIDELVGYRQRSTFITQAAERELLRLRQHEALLSTAGAWKDKDHPELKRGSAQWVRDMRRESASRLKRNQRARPAP
jgi:Arc/MetJ-type ribon-helix-helix transcriptional regulator